MCGDSSVHRHGWRVVSLAVGIIGALSVLHCLPSLPSLHGCSDVLVQEHVCG